MYCNSLTGLLTSKLTTLLIHLPLCSCQLSFQNAILICHLLNFILPMKRKANCLIRFLKLSHDLLLFTLLTYFYSTPCMLCIKHFQTFTHLFPLPGRLSTLTSTLICLDRSRARLSLKGEKKKDTGRRTKSFQQSTSKDYQVLSNRTHNIWVVLTLGKKQWGNTQARNAGFSSPSIRLSLGLSVYFHKPVSSECTSCQDRDVREKRITQYF